VETVLHPERRPAAAVGYDEVAPRREKVFSPVIRNIELIEDSFYELVNDGVDF